MNIDCMSSTNDVLKPERSSSVRFSQPSNIDLKLTTPLVSILLKLALLRLTQPSKRCASDEPISSVSGSSTDTDVILSLISLQGTSSQDSTLLAVPPLIARCPHT